MVGLNANRGSLRLLLGALTACAVAWVLAQTALWLYFVDQSHADRYSHRLGESQLQFPLSEPSDLIGQGAQNVRLQHFDRTGLLLHLGPGAANVPIGFDGRCLSSERFPMLRLEIDSSHPVILAIAQSPLAGGEQRTTELPLPAGPQSLNLDLRSLDWRAGSAARPLGDANGRVCEFRLVPVADRAIELKLSQLRFSQHPSASTAQASADAVAIPVLGRRPELVLLQRDQLRTHADREIWPEALSLAGHDGPIEDRDWLSYVAILLALLGAAASAAGPKRERLAIVLALAGPVLLLATNRIGESSAWSDWAAIATSILVLIKLGLRAKDTQSAWLGHAGAWRDAFVGVVVVVAVAGGWHLLSGQPARSLPEATDVLRYLMWAATQQTLLQRVLIPGLNSKAHALWAGLPAATAFALLHTPNLSLMWLCLCAGIWWSRHYQVHRSWLPLVAAHTCLGVLLPRLLPQEWLYSAEVGARYFSVS